MFRTPHRLLRTAIILLIATAWFIGSMKAQSVDLSLAQAQQYALQNSMSVKNSRYDAEAAKLTSDALLGTGLPQISASVQYQNYLNLPTSVIPGAIFGAPGQDVKVQFGVPHNMTAGVSVNQLLFNGTWLVGLQASRVYADLQNKTVSQSEQTIKKQVAETYQAALVVDETVQQLAKSLSVIESTLAQTQALLANGFAEQQDVDQLQLTASQIQSMIVSTKQQSSLIKDALKITIGIPITTEIVLTDKAADLLLASSADLLSIPFSPESTLDYQIVSGALTLQDLNVKAKKSELLPSLGGFYNLQTQALRREFNFFDTSKQWFPIQLWGVQLSVPILSGGTKMANIKKAQVEFQRTTDQANMLKQSLEFEYRSAKSGYQTALTNLEIAKKGVELSERVLETTNIKFKEGVATSFQIAQNTNQLIQAQSTYIQAMQNVLNARVRLAKALNQI